MATAGSIAALLGCSDANGRADSGAAAIDAGADITGTGGVKGTTGAGTGGRTAGTGGTGGNAGSPGTGGHGGMADAGGAAVTDGGGTGDSGADGGGTGDSGAGGGVHSQTCTNPPHVLPLNPQNPQDGITLSGFYVDTDTWNAANYDVSQTMYICDFDNWYVVANMNNDAGDGAVKTYPNVHKDFNDAPMISSFSTISSRFAHTAPHTGIYEYAYDIWLNGVAGSGSTEVMIWTDNYKQVPSGSSLDTVKFDAESYDVYKSGSYIAFVERTNVTSGTLNLQLFFDYIIGKGWIPATSTLGAIDYGIELVSTDGMDSTFEVNDFSLVTN